MTHMTRDDIRLQLLRHWFDVSDAVWAERILVVGACVVIVWLAR